MDEIEKAYYEFNPPPTYISYVCLDCGYKEDIDEHFIDDMWGWQELPLGKLPELLCPECDGRFIAKEDYAKKVKLTK